MAGYLDSHPEIREQHPRIYVKIRPAGTEFAFWALLDTGAHFCLLNASVAAVVRDHLKDSLGTFRVQTARGPLEGRLYRLNMTLVAEVGASLTFDATVFVPPDWHGPCFLGYTGALERMCCTLNPGKNQILFSSL